ncbi:MAG: hypothetical protein MZV64_62660 [Ignavibacteriales bacterium]|nr:hypothetical protein [Ignavibacteriales bacterium]
MTFSIRARRSSTNWRMCRLSCATHEAEHVASGHRTPPGLVARLPIRAFQAFQPLQ